MHEAGGVNTAVTKERYYDRVSYPALLLQLLSRASGLLSRPPRHGADDALMVVAAAQTLETLYFALPSDLRKHVDKKLSTEYRSLLNQIKNCVKQLCEKIGRGQHAIPKLSLLLHHQSATPVSLFLFHRTRYLKNEEGVIVGADVIDPSICIEGMDDALPRLFTIIAKNEALTPQQRDLSRVCVLGLRKRALIVLKVMIDALNEAGLLLEKGVVWVGQA